MTERAPQDDFDDPGTPLPGRRGAHRQAPRRLASVLPVVGVLTAVVAVGWAVTAAVGLTGTGGLASSSAESAAVSTPQATASAPTTAPTSDGAAPVEETTAGASTAGEGAEEPTAPSTSEPAPTSSSSSLAPFAPGPTTGSPSSPAPSGTSPSSTAPSVVDEDVDVIVLNATRTSGLAATTASALEADGWTVASTGNERDTQPAATVVLFPSADLEATAIAVAGDLGSRVIARLDPSVADDAITVLAGPDRLS